MAGKVELFMTIYSFGEYPEPINETAISEATKRWEEQSPTYSNDRRKVTITKLAVGILLAWGVVAAAVLTAVYGSKDISTLGIVLSSVFGCCAPFLTCALFNLGLSLRTYKPFKYDLDGPQTVIKIRKLLAEDSLALVANTMEGYCDHLSGAGILTKEATQDVKEYILRYSRLSEDHGWFMLKYSSEDILSDEKLLSKYRAYEDQKTLLKAEWEAYQTNHLLNSLPRPVVKSTEATSLNHAADHDFKTQYV